MSAVKLVIFDWDGTVMDSVGRIVSSMQAAALHTGIAVPSTAAVRHIIGLSLDPAFDMLFPSANPAQRQQLFEHYRDQYVQHDTTPTPLFADAEQVLQQLAERNVLLAVATGKARKGLDRMFAETGLARYFATSRCADEAQSKPHPDMLQQIIQQLGVAANEAIMVGDTSHDLKMAQAIAMPRIGVSHGAHDVAVLQQYAPLAIIDRLADLPAWVR
ncbi:HAD family hydrolase [Rheinheimera sp. UJ63]|uniref:HAD family hydrolase n=1 Tax=Rheinheimera sp. UJ63 TaxID=2910157 RepID=UPI001F18E586|nr:HAD-IA family hydrolase [Rheinheimera sp. UJ63]MCF4009466.1 HAD-IA family hydrolase [Rheinheimera sp. UJ63]